MAERFDRTKIQTLSAEQIQTLQVDAAARIIGTNLELLTQLNQEIAEAQVKVGHAQIELNQLKNDKSTIIEINRNLKVICQAG